jgi:hypothetical protein
MAAGWARSRLLRAAVGFALVPPTEPELRLLHRWLDCWRGVGDVVTVMNRQGYWLHLLCGLALDALSADGAP